MDNDRLYLDRRLMISIDSMKMLPAVLAVEHANHNAEEPADLRHKAPRPIDIAALDDDAIVS